MEEVTLQQILDARESRAARQQALLEEYGRTLLCFTMNIPGPVKVSAQIRRAFGLAEQMLLDSLKSEGIGVLYQQSHTPLTGCEGFYVTDAAPRQVKLLCAALEDSFPAGRLLDLDVISAEGCHISRESLGLPPRKCLLCDEDAKVCGRSRNHSVALLQAETHRLLEDFLDSHDARRIAAFAQKALLYEVCVTPKPGLVDRLGSGSHKDMDIFTFLSSTAALAGYFQDCALAGIRTRKQAPAETFRMLRALGRTAEARMYEATGGINTHKGAIFTLGILCGAAGCVGTDPAAISEQCKNMLQGLTRQDFAGITLENAKTAGEKLYAKYGITGIRGQAEAGFPAVMQVGLPLLQAALEEGISLNDAGCAVLLHLIACSDDTTLIARSDRDRQLAIRQQLRRLLQEDPFPDPAAAAVLDEQFTEKGLSCGGSADLLAATFFLHFAETGQIPQTAPSFF